MQDREVDVFISGAGPVGLVLAYQLEKQRISTYLIDSIDKASPDFPMYGRACSLFPRTIELLDQLDLFEPMAQRGLIARRMGATFKDGKRVQSRGWHMFENTQDTFFSYNLQIRLQQSETVLREELTKLGVLIHAPSTLVDYRLGSPSDSDDHRVNIDIIDEDGQQQTVKAKYLVGCDGTRSLVRSVARIPFEGSRTNERWVRIDGIVKTNLPGARYGATTIETRSYGNVIVAALDGGATRVGYALNPELLVRYEKGMTQEQAITEAQAAVSPFELDFEQVHWFTVYSISQRVASRLRDRDRVLLAGDAAHTHSSGSAQGMNTGMHDCISLGWRLIGVLKGWYSPALLDLYSEERQAVAERLIADDKIIASLVSGNRPESMRDCPEDPAVLLTRFVLKNTGFMNGLAIAYPPSLLHRSGYMPISVVPGSRVPDVRLYKHGYGLPTRLQHETKNSGKFQLVFFTGEVHVTAEKLRQLREQVDNPFGFRRFSRACDLLTIVPGYRDAVDEFLGIEKFGMAYWDMDYSAHTRYGVSLDEGCVMAVRPDGILGFVSALDGFDSMVDYLGGFMLPYSE